MAQNDAIPLNADLPLEALANRVAALMGTEPIPVEGLEGTGPMYDVRLGDGLTGVVKESEAPDDEPHVPWTQFRYLIVVADFMRLGAEARHAAAWRFYRAIVENTNWDTLLFLEDYDGTEVAASRRVVARSA
jgi:hypothetical protein